MTAISLKDVWLKYRIDFKEDNKFVSEDFWALKGVDLDIDRGESIAIIGENGAGKTTLLKLVAGMLKPDKGLVQVNGRVSAIMEIGAGFHRDLTGKENIYLISSLFGLSREQTDARYADIVDFASIGRFINAPVKSYSQGMYMRLAFAIAIHVDPDILVVDDTFAVGDAYARARCIDKIFDLKEKGMTIVFVLHDLEMAKRLCSRGIFLREGAVIKDGHMDVLCGYYMETVGDKEGIAILQKGDLGIIFNNGKLAIRWKDRSLTSGSCGSIAIVSSGRRYASNTAQWSAQVSCTKNEIVAVGTWPDISLREHWRITLFNEREFVWDIKVNSGPSTLLEGHEAIMIFTEGYKTWVTLESEKGFPKTFIHQNEWECSVVKDSFNNRFIALKNDNDKGLLPVFVLDRLQDDVNATCQIGNTGSDIRGRAIVYNISCKKALGCKDKPDNSRIFLGKIKLLEPKGDELEKYISYAKDTLLKSAIIRNGSLSILCKEHHIEIYWQDKLLTREVGLNLRFRCQDVDYCLLDGAWSVCKEDDKEIRIVISWDKAPFKQIWTLRLQNEGLILWSIDIEPTERIKITNKEMELVLSECYKRWMTAREKGEFDESRDENGGIILNNYINEAIGAQYVFENGNCVLPGIAFASESRIPKASYILKIEKRHPLLRFLEVDFEENSYIQVGRHRYFNGRIRILDTNEKDLNLIKIKEDAMTTIEKREDLSQKMQFRRLSLVFDNGKVRLFWKDIELTKGLALYSTVYSKYNWIDSSQAFWKIKELDKKNLIATGHWPGTPITQTWQIALLDERTILWKAIRQSWDNVDLEREQVNLMLSDRYTEWLVYNNTYGKFPKDFAVHNGIFWDRMWHGSVAFPIGVNKYKLRKGIFNREVLPGIIFDCSRNHESFFSIIENTDNLFKARILQCELSADKKNSSFENKTKYFEGQIKIID